MWIISIILFAFCLSYGDTPIKKNGRDVYVFENSDIIFVTPPEHLQKHTLKDLFKYDLLDMWIGQMKWEGYYWTGFFCNIDDKNGGITHFAFRPLPSQ